MRGALSVENKETFGPVEGRKKFILGRLMELPKRGEEKSPKLFEGRLLRGRHVRDGVILEVPIGRLDPTCDEIVGRLTRRVARCEPRDGRLSGVGEDPEGLRGRLPIRNRIESCLSRVT